ncbi:Cys-tRNA(Pro) deacylase [Granulosicoccaceae sp. 1_MG-2023]|nr:Cys-tRNA(Pro) deacylase [Granulosicoccaceae sp. 1_MG-2023]
MTPAINLARKKKIPHTVHEYTHEPGAGAYGTEAARKLGIDPARVFKTLVVMLDNGKLAVALVPVAERLSLKAAAKALGARKASMAEPAHAERATGYVTGGISPLGQKKRLAMTIDDSAAQYETIFVSAGRRGLEIELSPKDLQSLTGAVSAALCQQAH